MRKSMTMLLSLFLSLLLCWLVVEATIISQATMEKLQHQAIQLLQPMLLPLMSLPALSLSK